MIAESMSNEEMTVLYYIANLVMISRHKIVKTICEKNLILMKKASSFFKANVARYLALCLMQNCEFGEAGLGDEDRIITLLQDCYDGFEKTDSHWGMGIAKHMLGKFYMLFVELNSRTETFKESLSNRDSFSSASDKSI